MFLLRICIGTGKGGSSLDLVVLLLRLDAVLVAESAASGLEVLDEAAELIEAWAVLAESDAVGGPDENMDLVGVLNMVVCGVVSPDPEESGTWPAEAAICCRAGLETELVRGIGAGGRREGLVVACVGRGE